MTPIFLLLLLFSLFFTLFSQDLSPSHVEVILPSASNQVVEKAKDENDLGKTIKHFEIKIKNETILNPLEKLLRKKNAIPLDERTLEKQKEENLYNEEKNRFVNKEISDKNNSKSDLDQISNNVTNISTDENLKFSNIINDTVPLDKRSAEKKKEENLYNEERNRFVNKEINDQNQSKSDIDQILNNVNNITIDDNLNFSSIINDINNDLEEKEKFFHFDDSLQDFGEDNKTSSGISGFLSIILILTICTFSLIIISIRNLLQKLFESYILETLKNILMDIIILISVITVVELCYYHGLFDRFLPNLDIYGISLGFSMFAIIWFTVSVIYTVYFQYFINEWNSTEMLFNRQDESLKKYKDAYNIIKNASERNSSVSFWDKLELESNKKKIEYFLMRQTFIAPSYLPVVGEAFLRDDFNFAEYLGRSLSDTFTRTFVFSVSSFLIALSFSYLWIFFTIIPNKALQIYLMLSVPYVIVLMVLIFVLRIRKICKLCILEIKEPADNYVANFTQRRNPFVDFCQPMPLYLERENNFSQKRIEESLKGGLKLPNKLENLFPLSSPLFTIKCINFFMITLTMWLIVGINSIPKNLKKEELVEISLFWTALFLISLCYFIWIPFMLKRLSIVTKIGMLKDPKIIQEVVFSYRNVVTPKFAKLYRLFKSLRKQILLQDSKAELEQGLQEVLANQMKTIKEQIEEYFNILKPNGDKDQINFLDLKALAHLCGYELMQDELIFFAREVIPNAQVPWKVEESEDIDKLKKIKIDKTDFLKAIYLMSEDVKLDPYNVSKEILSDLAKLGCLENENSEPQEMEISQFKNFLDNQIILEKDDINIILNEIYYISEDGKYFDIDKLACLIRDYIEGLPR